VRDYHQIRVTVYRWLAMIVAINLRIALDGFTARHLGHIINVIAITFNVNIEGYHKLLRHLCDKAELFYITVPTASKYVNQ